MHEETTGTLRIVARRSYGLRHVVPHLANFQTAHPRVEIDLATPLPHPSVRHHPDAAAIRSRAVT